MVILVYTHTFNVRNLHGHNKWRCSDPAKLPFLLLIQFPFLVKACIAISISHTSWKNSVVLSGCVDWSMKSAAQHAQENGTVTCTDCLAEQLFNLVHVHACVIVCVCGACLAVCDLQRFKCVEFCVCVYTKYVYLNLFEAIFSFVVKCTGVCM
jgi:hypothetical protein